MEIALSDSIQGYLTLTLVTWFVTIILLIVGAVLRRRILSWDDKWRDSLEATGTTLEDYTKDIEATFIKIRSTSRLLGVFLVALLLLVGALVFLGLASKPVLGPLQIANGLWLVSLVALALVLPAFVSFSVGQYLSETMLLKANVFLHMETKESVREKKQRYKMIEMTRQLREKHAALKDAAKRGAPAVVEAPAPAKK